MSWSAKSSPLLDAALAITTATYGSSSAATIRTHMTQPWPTITAATKQTVRMPIEMT